MSEEKEIGSEERLVFVDPDGREWSTDAPAAAGCSEVTAAIDDAYAEAAATREAAAATQPEASVEELIRAIEGDARQ